MAMTEELKERYREWIRGMEMAEEYSLWIEAHELPNFDFAANAQRISDMIAAALPHRSPVPDEPSGLLEFRKLMELHAKRTAAGSAK